MIRLPDGATVTTWAEQRHALDEQIHLDIHADGRWCEDGNPMHCSGRCRELADLIRQYGDWCYTLAATRYSRTEDVLTADDVVLRAVYPVRVIAGMEPPK